MSAIPKRERILALDLLRGYFLSVILIDHFAMYPNLFDFVSGRGQLWASAAEGFFLISGLLVGYVYTPRLASSPLLAGKKLFQRALKLWVAAVLLTWTMTFFGNLFVGQNIKAGLWIDPPLGKYLLKTLTLQYNYGWTDFLVYYVGFLIIAPFALWLCTKRLGWLVMLVSFLVWLQRDHNFVQSWQILFTWGIVGGYYLPAIEKKFKALPRLIKKRVFITLSVVTISTIILSALTVIVATFFVRAYPNFAQLPGFLQTILLNLDRLQKFTDHAVYKWTLEPMRLVVALVWFSTAYMWFRRFEGPINKLTRGYLKTLGEASLLVYGVHGVLVFFVLVLLPDWYGYLLSSLITAGGLAFLYLVARYRHIPKKLLHQRIPRYSPES